jgi:hypothetical protein
VRLIVVVQGGADTVEQAEFASRARTRRGRLGAGSLGVLSPAGLCLRGGAREAYNPVGAGGT